MIGSVKSSKRSISKTIKRQKQASQPQKLNPTDRKLHSDNLADDHFEAQRFILRKKQVVKRIEEKMKAHKRGESIGGARGSMGSDIDPETVAVVSPSKVAGETIKFSTKERT